MNTKVITLNLNYKSNPFLQSKEYVGGITLTTRYAN